jgi:uncharacterized protein YndB with AHSA1/START domain
MTSIIADKNRQDIFIKRQFNASKDLVFKLYTDIDLQKRCQSAFLQNFEFVEFKPEIGGNYHHTHTGQDGKVYGFKGIYHDVILNEKIIKTSEFLGLPFKVLPTLEILSFDESQSITNLTIQIICDSEVTRDAMVQHGMRPHFEAVFEEMDVLLNQ